MKSIFKLLVLMFSITGLISGCKLAVMVVEGGRVMSDSSGDCLSGSICIIEINDTNFTDVFEAVPNEGWYFDSWQSGNRFFCGGSTTPFCSLSFQGQEANQILKDVVASSDTFYLMPLFRTTEPDNIFVVGGSVVVDGREWLQPVDFIGYSYEEVGRVCPEGVCSGYLPRSNQDLSGYVWASKRDVEALFKSYRSVQRPLSRDFEKTADEGSRIPYILYVMLSDPPIYQEDIDGFYTYMAAVVGDGIDSASEARDIFPGNQWPNQQSDIVGLWFWRPVD